MNEKKFLEHLVRPKSKEDSTLEWKATMRFCLSKQSEQNYVRESLCKSICSSANNEGGRILVGYDETSGSFIGVETDNILLEDGSLDEDKWKRSLLNKLTSFAGPVISNLVKIQFFSYDVGVTCALLYVERAKDLIPCKDKHGNEKIYVRQDGNNDPLETIDDIKKFEKQRNQRPKNGSPKGWSTDFAGSYLDKEILSLPWERVGIVDRDISHLIPAKPGIYIFTASQDDDTNGLFSTFKSPMYVGISEVDILGRFKRHIKKKEFKECIKIYQNKFEFHCAVIQDMSKQELEIIEHRLILKFGPSLNQNNSPGKKRQPITYV